jgi:hypothetical protein
MFLPKRKESCGTVGRGEQASAVAWQPGIAGGWHEGCSSTWLVGPAAVRQTKVKGDEPAMTKVYLYVVASSGDPDRVTCSVPYQVDDTVIFFGPCKKRLREALRAAYLAPGIDSTEPGDDLYVVGVNGGNGERIRKVVWAGRIRRVMTFACAYQQLTEPRYRALRNDPDSPLHVHPLFEQSRFAGYEHVTSKHVTKDDWVTDFVKKYDTRYVRLEGKKLLLQPGVSAWQGFPRDACLLLDNIFFAQGQGLSIDARLMEVLRRAQPGREIDTYAIFGYQQNGAIDGRTGNYLTLEDPLAGELVRWLGQRRPPATVDQPHDRDLGGGHTARRSC